MPKRKDAPGYVPNDTYSQEDWNEVSDNAELTDEELAKARPFADAFPELAAAMRRKPGQRGKGKKQAKVSVSIRLAPDIVERYRAAGPGWRARMESDLRKAAGLK